MVSGYNRNEPEHTPPRARWPVRMHLLLAAVFLAALLAGTCLASWSKYGTLPW